MTGKEFAEKYNRRMCEKCCASCIYGRDLMCDGAYDCVHPDLNGDSIITEAESVCDAWKCS